MPWPTQQRADLERAKEACVAKEALLVCGRRMKLLRVLEMHIEEERWWALLERVGFPEKAPIRIQIPDDALQDVSIYSWDFPEIGEHYHFEERYIRAFKHEQAEGFGAL